MLPKPTLGKISIIKRNGHLVDFDETKIAVALGKAFYNNNAENYSSEDIDVKVNTLTKQVVEIFTRRLPTGGAIHIEEIQDQVELVLMRCGEYVVAKAYVIYRDQHVKQRAVIDTVQSKPVAIDVQLSDGTTVPFDEERLRTVVQKASNGLAYVNVDEVMSETIKNLYNGIKDSDLRTTLMMITRTKIEQNPNYGILTARLLYQELALETTRFLGVDKHLSENAIFTTYLDKGIELGLLNPVLKELFDLDVLSAALKPERTNEFTYLGLQTLYDRYFLHSEDTRFELPQCFFMRVCMGLSLNEDHPTERAVEFYNLISNFDYMPSTPTLFNSGTLTSQMSSCYLTTIPDDLEGIYNSLKDNALLSKWAGGLGNDWTPIRALNAHIKGTNGKSQGVVPFLKVANDTAVAVNQCFSPDTLVMTSTGVVRIDTVHAGMLVLSHTGMFRSVIAIMSYSQTGPMLLVCSDVNPTGDKVTTEHPFLIKRPGTDEHIWVPANKLNIDDLLVFPTPQEVIDASEYVAVEYAQHLISGGSIVNEWNYLPLDKVRETVSTITKTLDVYVNGRGKVVLTNIMQPNVVAYLYMQFMRLGHVPRVDNESRIILDVSGLDGLLTGPFTKTDMYRYVPITMITDVDPCDVVYDLRVEKDESYVITSGIVHNGGKRKGAVCAYLETWHLDIEEFVELRKNTGDDRRRTHDMNTANWVPDLFMERVFAKGTWTLFSPSDVSDLHDLYGNAFRTRYTEYEQMTKSGELKLFKTVQAVDLWRKMLSMVFETGHPWITFKDACNLRSPQSHVGVVHSSNLCCIAGDQRVVTDRGLLTVKELYELGGKNKVVGLDGIYDATEMFLPRPNAEMGIIETAEGYTHKVTPDHPVWVCNDMDGTEGWKQAQHLTEYDEIALQCTFGLWGDITVTSNDSWVHVRVPGDIWTANRESVVNYIRHLESRYACGDANSGIVSYTLPLDAAGFIDDVKLLLLNLGVRADITNNTITYHALLMDTIPDGIHTFPQVYSRFTRYVRIPNEDAYCLTVDSETHAWTVNGFITKNTEITLNTSAEEIAVCNLGSINLPRHVTAEGLLDTDKLSNTIETAVRMLDNVIDLNFYPVKQAKTSNMKHRPIGLGIMGFQDALYKMKIPYDSQAAVDFADKCMEVISFDAIAASCSLSKQYGSYESYEGSDWDKGILPIDTVSRLYNHREIEPSMDMSQSLDWTNLRKQISLHGMRNSNVLAIAPTATISNICGVAQSIEPTFQNLYVKSNLSGEFTIINQYLVDTLTELGLWDIVMINDIKRHEGDIQNISRIPAEVKRLFKTAFDIDPKWLIDCASRRQKWIDQAQSLNLYMAEASGKKLDTMYKHAWSRGLKTTYYLRAKGATSSEKSTVNTTTLNNVVVETGSPVEFGIPAPVPLACSIDNPDCEACQ